LSKYRILIGRLSQETHSFSPIATSKEDFAVKRGRDIIEGEELGCLGGIISAAIQEDVELVPSISAMARPGGPVLHEAYASFKKEILQVIQEEKIDGVALDLHGAMQTDELDDPEGDLLEAIRLAVGEHVTIATGLDLHAHITPRMLTNANFCTGYKHNPHSDVFETGNRVLIRLLDILNGNIRPVTALNKVPMLTRGRDETTEGHIKEIHDFARALMEKHPALFDISIFNVQHFLDAPGLGQAVIAVTDDDPHLACEITQDLCNRLWAIRDEVVASFPSIEETINKILTDREQRPYVLGDIGDRVVAGAPGDSPALLRYLLEKKLSLRAAIPITDPEAVEEARNAGVGATITVKVGGRFTPAFEPVEVTGKVIHLGGTDEITLEDSFNTFAVGSLGRTAVLQIDKILLLLMSRSGIVMFPHSYTSQGIDISELDFVVAKSGYHFKIFFEGIATPLCVDTPGLTVFRPEEFPFTRGRPFYPLDDIKYEAEAPLIFSRQR
jgi:microcystin degradation protein MlrC